jgi:hypothetical protein
VAALAVFGVVLSTQAGAAPAALPALSISDSEGTNYQTATSSMTFTVTLSAASATTVTVDYSTRDEGDSDDWEPAVGTLKFAPGETSKTIEVALKPEPGKTFEEDEIFYVDLSNPVNATFAKNAGAGILHFSPEPTPQQVNVTTKGEGGQCVQTVDSSSCVPLSGEFQFEIADVKYINPGRRAIELHTNEGTFRFYGASFGVDKIAAAESGTGKPMVAVSLRGGSFAACKNRALSRSTSGVSKEKPKPQAVRRLWGKGQGSYRTKGRYSSGTVRGTWWETVDRCDGTRTLVREGVVRVYDFVLKKHVKVEAGQSYVASPSKQP